MMSHEVQKHFPNAYCTSYKNKFWCIGWAFELEPIIAVGPSPKRAWANAAKLVRGKNKEEAIEKLKKVLMEKELNESH